MTPHFNIYDLTLMYIQQKKNLQFEFKSSERSICFVMQSAKVKTGLDELDKYNNCTYSGYLIHTLTRQSYLSSSSRGVSRLVSFVAHCPFI